MAYHIARKLSVGIKLVAWYRITTHVYKIIVVHLSVMGGQRKQT